VYLGIPARLIALATLSNWIGIPGPDDVEMQKQRPKTRPFLLIDRLAELF
jgi:hypothetical protein